MEKEIDVTDVDKQAEDAWLFLAKDAKKTSAVISKKAFIVEVGIALQEMRGHYQKQLIEMQKDHKRTTHPPQNDGEV